MLAVLSAVETIGKPVGANMLMRSLEQTGLQVSFATAGRILAELESEGYLRKNSEKAGRLLSEKGVLFLAELRQEARSAEFAQELVEKLTQRDPKTILDVLVARLAIEKQIARLVTTMATDNDLQGLRDCVLKEQNARDWDTVVKFDDEFHSRLAKAAGNSALEAVLSFIKRDPDIPKILAFIRKQEGYRFGKEHLEIVEALETRNPDLAEDTIANHINKIISDINVYFSRKKNETKED
jgi:Transcriptional regulators